VRLLAIGLVVSAGILAVALVLAYLLVLRLQRTITTPLSNLAQTARAVASRKDYSLRVERSSDDEIGALTDAFNSMLEEVSERDLALSGAKQQLAAQVTVLQHEIGERQRAEAESQRAKEAAEDANRAKSAFLATMSHEIRTPMNGVLATANLLLDSPLNDEQRELASLIRVSGEGLLTVLNDILDFSKLEAGRVRLEHTDFDLRELIEDAVELHAVAAAGKGLDVAADIHPEVSTFVQGDPYRLRQILMNLIGNAVKFTAQGEVVVSVASAAGPGDQAQYLVEVRDSGIGMSAEAQSQLFKPFTQADSSTTRKFGGTGLGLAISKALVELMNGTIGVKSQLGAGSTFWISIPLRRQSIQPATATRIEALGEGSLLVIEPNEKNRQRLRRQLATWSLRCAEASDTESAIAAVRNAQAENTPIAAALVCVAPAEGPGLALSRRLRAEPLWNNRPVILLTNQTERLAARGLSSEGVSACLFRPMRMRQLAATLRRLLSPASLETPAATTTNAPFSGEALRVLLVEDNAVNQRVATLMLRKANCEITFAGDGLQALGLLAKDGYDLVLMDCQMPQLDGFETTRRIRQAETVAAWGERPRQYIVAMTANAMEGDRERCLEAGMDDYISKPMRTAQLEAVIAQARELRAAA
jgi:two-component system, sensor histidine kinase and response regulator